MNMYQFYQSMSQNIGNNDWLKNNVALLVITNGISSLRHHTRHTSFSIIKIFPNLANFQQTWINSATK